MKGIGGWRNEMSMKALLALLLLLPAGLGANDSTERSRILAVFDEVNTSQGFEPAVLRKHFARDIDPREVEPFLLLQSRMADRRPWSETTIPRLVLVQVRFVTPEVALVEASVTQFGPFAWRRDPMLFVMRKQGAEWQVFSIRMRSGDRW
jgi:hypothetical protein